MAYFSEAHLRQVTFVGQDVEVELAWAVGDQECQLVQVYLTLPSMFRDELVAQVTPDEQPLTLMVPAPASGVLVQVAPRLTDPATGDLLDYVHAEDGSEIDWVLGRIGRLITVTGDAVKYNPPGGPLDAPTITRVDVPRGSFEVSWESESCERFIVRVTSPSDERAQVDLPGSWRQFRVDRHGAGAIGRREGRIVGHVSQRWQTPKQSAARESFQHSVDAGSLLFGDLGKNGACVRRRYRITDRMRTYAHHANAASPQLAGQNPREGFHGRIRDTMSEETRASQASTRRRHRQNHPRALLHHVPRHRLSSVEVRLRVGFDRQ
jgi:hypothetical protein